MLWHGSDQIFSKFSLDQAGRASGRATNGALGVWCVYGGSHAVAMGYAGENGAIYEIEEPSGKTYDMPIGDLSRHHRASMTLDEVDDSVGYYDRIRRDLIEKGYDRINIIEGHGSADMCILLEPEKIRILERTVTIIPHDRLNKVLGVDGGEIISDEEFAKFHTENRRRLLGGLCRHISNMGVEDLASNGSRNFSTRVGELNQRRLPFQDALTRLTETHEQIWRDTWAKIQAEMDEAEARAFQPAEGVPEPAY